MFILTFQASKHCVLCCATSLQKNKTLWARGLGATWLNPFTSFNFSILILFQASLPRIFIAVPLFILLWYQEFFSLKEFGLPEIWARGEFPAWELQQVKTTSWDFINNTTRVHCTKGKERMLHVQSVQQMLSVCTAVNPDINLRFSKIASNVKINKLTFGHCHLKNAYIVNCDISCFSEFPHSCMITVAQEGKPNTFMFLYLGSLSRRVFSSSHMSLTRPLFIFLYDTSIMKI